jgi:ParB family chromosome partitioning protein
MEIELSDIIRSPHQVRTISGDEELRELAESIRDNGLLQPIKVRPTGQGYELVYGHRRVAAMRLLGWTRCEAIVEEVDDRDSLVQSLVENLQREDLDVLEEARSYRNLAERGYTLRQIAELVKKPQGRISNRLSILRLPPQVQQLVRFGRGQHETTTEQGGLSLDSASRIASAAETSSEAAALARKALDEKLSSRQVRELTRLLNGKSDPGRRERLIRESWQATERDLLRDPSDQTENDIYSPSYETFSTLVHRKLMWNLGRLDVESFDHFTIGYSKRTLDQFIALLRLAEVELVADVRYTPISRFRPGFSKSNLRDFLAEHGIGYRHCPELGVPPRVRRSFQNAADLDSLFSWYDSHIQPELKVAKYNIELATKRVAFMCVEFDPQSCHRHLIAIYLEKEGYSLLDL